MKIIRRDNLGRIFGEHPIKQRCRGCFAIFITYRSHNRHFCSHKCYWKNMPRLYKGENASNWKVGKTITCPTCRTQFRVSARRKAKYCSQKCYGLGRTGQHFPKLSKAKRGIPPPNKGKKMPQITGHNNYLWKGEKAGYHSKHSWVYRHKGQPKRCIDCGSTDKLEWSNVDHKYHRKLNDYIARCHKCHAVYDHKYNVKK